MTELNLMPRKISGGISGKCRDGITDHRWFGILFRLAGLLALLAVSPGRCLAQAANNQEVMDSFMDKDEIAARDLINAVVKGDLAAVKALLDKGARVDSRNDKGSTGLQLAAREGHREIVNLLLAKGADVKAKNHYENTALSFAVGGGHAEIVEVLLDKGADVNTVEENESTPLTRAAWNGNVRVVKSLLARKADVNYSKKSTGETPLMFAANPGHVEAVEALIAAGADVNAKTKTNQTALMTAACNGHLKVVEKLVASKADIEVIARCGGSNCDGHTALTWAVRRGHTEVVRLLISKGVDVRALGGEAMDEAGKEGRIEIEYLLAEAKPVFKENKGELDRALKEAVAQGAYEKVQALITKGANVNSATNSVKNPVIYALRTHHPDIVKLLLKNGANPNLTVRDMTFSPRFGEERVDDGWTALMFAAESAPSEIVGTFIEQGANVNQTSEYGNTPLLLAAARTNRTEVVRLLLEKGASVDPTTKEGATALHLVVENNDAKAARLLLEKGAKASQPRKDGNTPLHLAVQHNNLGIVRLLLEKGSAVDAKNGTGGTPLAYAENDFYTDIADALKKGGAAPVDLRQLKLPNPLFKANDQDDLEKVKFLVAKGADVKAHNEAGDPPLVHLLRNSWNLSRPNARGIARFYVSNGADVNDPGAGKYPLPPLLSATSLDDLELVSLMLEKGAKPDTATDRKETALMQAVNRGNLEMVRLLIKAGADVQVRNGYGKTALSIAVEMKQHNPANPKKYEDIASALKEAGAKE